MLVLPLSKVEAAMKRKRSAHHKNGVGSPSLNHPYAVFALYSVIQQIATIHYIHFLDSCASQPCSTMARKKTTVEELLA
jgi:hypothetical protein